jgi:predicted permease
LLRLDVRHCIRSLWAQRTLTVTAVLSIALGVGLASPLLGIVDRLFIRPPEGVVRPEEVVRLYYKAPDATYVGTLTSFPAYVAMRDHARQVSGLAAEVAKTITIRSGADARAATAELVTSNYFHILGVEPVEGRFFVPNEEAPAAVISYGLWRTEFAGASAVVGQVLRVAGLPYTIIGIAPRGFNGIDAPKIDVWLPITAASRLVDAAALESPTLYWVSVFGRLSNVSTDAASELSAILHAQDPMLGTGDRLRVTLGPVLFERGPAESANARVSLWVACASLMLLLITAANVTNLLLSRLLGRRGEFFIRIALGASHARLALHVLLDIAIIAAAGTCIGIILGEWSTSVAMQVLFPALGLSGPRFDARQMFIVAVLGLATAIVITGPTVAFVLTRDWNGLATALTLLRTRHYKIVAGAFVVAQCAIGIVLLTGAALFGLSLRNVNAIPIGFDAKRLLYVTVDFSATLSGADAYSTYEDLAKRVLAVPGVQDATVVMGPPLGIMWAVATTLPGDVWRGPNPVVLGHAVGRGYFQITGLPIKIGRPFNDAERQGRSKVAVINDAMAHAFWTHGSPIDACLKLGDDRDCTRVVGVAANTPRSSITADREYELYLPIESVKYKNRRTLALVVQAAVDPHTIEGPVRRLVQSASPLVAFAQVTAVSDILAPELRPWQAATAVLSSFTIVGLVIAAIGLGGVLAFEVDQEMRAMGIRLALGARRGAILGSVMLRGMVLCSIGAGLGILFARLVAPLAQSLLYGIAATSRPVYILVSFTMIIIGAVASFLPAYRASNADVVTLLRQS